MADRSKRLLVAVLHLGAGLFVGSCTDDVSSDGGPSPCIDGDLCIGTLVCVDGFCVEPGGSETVGDGDGDPGDGDGDPGDGDGDPGDGDGDGDGDGEPDPMCGNGQLEAGETCDDGNDVNTDTCLDTCELASCGDGFVGPGEGCDDGNDVDDDACNNACALTSCGDGQLQQGEACDDGNDVDSDACLSTCVLPSCGDGQVWADAEECDDANPDDQDACLSTCVNAVCGDGAVWNGQEPCDDGNLDDTDACLTGCVAPTCGDGHVWAGEEDCDDANDVETDTCLTSCEAASCGDGFVGPGESCDDGNGNDLDACNNSCAPTSCGDGIVQQGESCDDGNPSNTDGCLISCAQASCGDGFLWGGMEACDDGNVANSDACVSGCELASCGDGFVQQGVEVCDDGDLDDTDACVSSCESAVCGDGFVQQGVEACDDGDLQQDDDCSNACELPACGDGILQQGQGEGCDDGDLNGDQAACKLNCQPAVCGDNLVWQGSEGCDDGNLNDLDGCEADCELTPITLSVSTSHVCALLGPAVRCWGGNSSGALGIGNSLHKGDQPGELPAPFANVGGDVIAIETGAGYTCAIRAGGGGVRCWGGGWNGVLGNGSVTNIGDGPGEMPPPAVNVGGGTPVLLAIGWTHTCVVLDDGTTRCWGDNGNGKLGYGHSDDLGDQLVEMPTPAVNVGGTPVQIDAGSSHTCVLLDTGEVRCWGANSSGKLGYGHTDAIGDEPFEMPPPAVDLGGGTVVEIGVGSSHTCARFDDGTVRCWGFGFYGQLGYGNQEDIGDQPGEMPPPVINVGGSVIDFATGGHHNCVVLMNGNVKCWGSNASGDLGYPHNNNYYIGDVPNEMPPATVNLGGAALVVETKTGTTCVLMQSNQVLCWGDNDYGQLGIGSTSAIGDHPGEMPPAAVPLF